MQRKKTNDLKVCNGWTQKWMSPNRKNNDLYIREIVRGPFSSPKLLVSQPIIELSTCQRQAANVNENRNDLRHGIPDAWKEYLARTGFCNSIETRVLQKNLIPSCVRSFATERIWNELGLPLVQGIPDPWKCKFLFQRRSVKCLQRRCAYNNKISAQIACIYDGDDEAEIEHSAKKHFNKDCVVNNTDPLRDENKELFSSQTKKLGKYKNNLEKVKSNVGKHDDERVIDKHSKGTQHGRPVRKFKNDFNTKKNISTAPTINNTKKKAKFTQMNVIPTKEKLVQTPNLCKGTKNQTENNREKNVQKSNIVCCNCTLPYHAYSNIKNCPQRASPFQRMNVSNLVLCRNCENMYHNRDSQQVNNTMKTKATCVRNPKNVGPCKTISQKRTDKRKKHKLSDCFRKEKTRFKQEKSNIYREQGLQLVCGRCNNPYLKIASFCATATDQKTLCVCKKEEENKIRNGISKHSMTRKQSSNIVRSSKNYLCTWTESKMHISREDLGPSPCSIKTGNNVSKKNSYDDVTFSAMSSEMKINPEDDDRIFVEDRVIENPGEKIIPKNMHSRSYIDGRKRNQLSEGNRYNVKRKNIKWENKSNANAMIVEEKHNVKQLQQVRLDPTLQYVVSDSGEYADVSDNFIDDDNNDTYQDTLPVTSITFMRQLKSTMPIRKLYRKLKLQKTYRFRKNMSRNNIFDFEQVSNIEDNTMNDNKNVLDCDVLYCSELVKDDNSEI